MSAVDPRRALVIGTLWSVAMRWSIKGMGLASTVVLARILSPGDYGVVAMAMLMVGLAEVLLDFGAGITLLREPNADRDFIDSAWTLAAFQGLLVALLLALAAPLAGLYFKEPRVVWVIWAIAPCVAFGGFGNIGITLARKELNFALEFRYSLASKLLGMLVTIAAALWLRDHRALVVGIATGYIGGMLLSYLMHPYRPRFSVVRLGAMWHFSKWLLLGGFGQFAIRKIDELVVGRLGTTGQFGVYTVGADIGQMATAEIGPPINRTLLPTLSTLHHDLSRMRSVTLKTLSVLASIVLPLGVGLALVAPSATLVLLGPKWVAATPFIAIFALVGAVRTLTGPPGTLLLVLGYSKLQATNIWIEFVVFVVAALALVPSQGFTGLAYARLISAFAITALYFGSSHRHAQLALADLAGALWRPLLGVAGMALVLLWLDGCCGFATVAQLVLEVALGGVLYTGWMLGSWWAVGRPDGIERLALERLGLQRWVRAAG